MLRRTSVLFTVFRGVYKEYVNDVLHFYSHHIKHERVFLCACICDIKVNCFIVGIHFMARYVGQASAAAIVADRRASLR